MPIKGMTDTQRATFPRIGVLRKGAPKPTNSNAPGKDLEWFRFVTEDQDAAHTFSAAFGENPASIGVMLPFGTLDENLEAWMEEWGAGSLKHRCDGEYCAIWQDPDGTYHEAGKCRCGAVHPPEPCPGKCKPTGRLMVIIPELRRLAYVQVLTTSKHDILELTGNLKAAEDTARMMGRDLRGIPFILTRVPREISTPPRQGGNGKRVRAEKWLLHIEPAPSWVALQIEAAQRMALPMIEAAPDIPYPNGNDDDDVIVAETEIVDDKGVEHPETEVVDPPSTNGEVPVAVRKAPGLLKYVNEHVQVPYDNVSHLRNELAEAGLEGDKWPAYSRDPQWWQRAFDLAFEIAESKEYTEAA